MIPRSCAVSSLAIVFMFALPCASPPVQAASAADSVGYSERITSGSRIAATLTNYGFLGNNFVTTASSLEYPVGTGYEHLPNGGLWFGAHATDGAGAFTGVVTGCLDISQGAVTPPFTEFTPAGNAFLVRSINPLSPDYSPAAVSESDLIASFSDQPAGQAAGNPEVHRPMGILVRQQSYSWSWASLQDVLFLRFAITNTGAAPLTDAWVGLYTQFASGRKYSYSCWPPSSSCSPLGGWYSKKWLQYEDSLRLVREHFCFSQPPPTGCALGLVPYWIGAQILTPPGVGQQVTLAAWPWAPGDPARDLDTERYALMSSGAVQDLTQSDLLPGTGDPVELLAIGPFPLIAVGDSIQVDFAIVGGADEAEIHRHAIIAQQVHDALYDAVTPALISLVSAEATPGSARLVWQGAEGAGYSATIERRGIVGDWAAIAEVSSDGLGRVTYEDRTVVAEHRYGYRLALREDGSVRYAGETWVDVPGAASLALHGLRPNPASRGIPVVAFSIAGDAPATLDVFDLTGRRVWSRALAGLGAGSHLVPLEDAGALAPGIYVLRLTQGARAVTARAVVTR